MPCLKIMEMPILCLLQIILNTDETVGDLRQQLAYIYEAIFVEYVIKNPLYAPGKSIE